MAISENGTGIAHAGHVAWDMESCDRPLDDPTGPDVGSATTTEQWPDFLSIGLDPRRAEEMEPFVIDLVTEDTGETHGIEPSCTTSTKVEGELPGDANLTITVDRKELNDVMMGFVTFDSWTETGVVHAG